MPVYGVTDTLTAIVQAKIRASLVRSDYGPKGDDVYLQDIKKNIANGTGSSQATGAYTHTGSVPTGGVTISLAAFDLVDSANNPVNGGPPPSEDPEGKRIKGLLIENLDSTNYMTVRNTGNAITGIIGGTSTHLKIDPGGFFLWFSPTGAGPINDGTDDELAFFADTAEISQVRLTYVFG